MADFSVHKISIGDLDYPVKHDAFIDDTEGYATEVETAREGESNLITNLQSNYVSYTLAENISGSSTYKCINMIPGILGSNDYCTVAQAESLRGSVPSDITDLVPGSTLSPNDILVVNPDGDAITGRPTTYTNVPVNSLANGNYDMNLGGGPSVTALPAGGNGIVISYADIGGNITLDNKLTITPDSGEKIMGLTPDETLVIDDYPYCSFDLVYTGSTIGWALIRFQR